MSTFDDRPTASGQMGVIPVATIKGLVNKVPEITLFFWLIKILCTTVGETAADFLNDTLGLGLTGTTIVTTALLIGALYFQFRSTAYRPGVYWVTVVLISVVGTLITDSLTDHFEVPLALTTAVFAVALGATFVFWHGSEKTLSIHSITSARREAFYWLAILFTFALGTAAGDYLAETSNVGYWRSALIFAGMIGVVAVMYFSSTIPSVPAFWMAYVLTRPLGASIGDYVSQPHSEGGLGAGTVVTSGVFLVAITGLVVYLAMTRIDAPGQDVLNHAGR